MNDEEFEATMTAFYNLGWETTVDDLRERDAAQREALAQMQSERDQYDDLHIESIKRVSELQKRLDNSIELLQYLLDAPGVSPLMQSKTDMALYEIDENHSKKQY